MNVVKTGLAIGVLCAIWQIIMAASGWITDPARTKLFYLVIPIEIALLVWGLKRAASIKSYGGRVLAGTAMAAVAAAFLFFFSLVLTKILFPNLMVEMRAVQEKLLREAGRGEAEIGMALSLQTPIIQATMGAIGTLITGVLTALIGAVFLRKRNEGVT